MALCTNNATFIDKMVRSEYYITSDLIYLLSFLKKIIWY